MSEEIKISGPDDVYTFTREEWDDCLKAQKYKHALERIANTKICNERHARTLQDVARAALGWQCLN